MSAKLLLLNVLFLFTNIMMSYLFPC